MEPYVVLARRYRPRTFEDVLGQEAVGRTLKQAIETGRVAHAYLFSGPRGIGKTSMARILAKALCCLKSDGPTATPCDECEVCTAVAKGDDLDVIEIDGASNRGIDEVRTLRENAQFSPARARLKIYVIDEVHMLTEAAFNALLKILEEPPAHVKFIFATTEPQKVPATILSRCQRFDFRRIPTRTIVKHLEAICRQEGVEAPEEALLAVAQSSQGGMRDAQSLLDQLITLGEGGIRAGDLEQLLGTVSRRSMEDLFRAVGEGDAGRAIELFEQAYDQGIDPTEFLKQVLADCRDFLVLLACGAETELVELTPESRIAAGEVAKAWGRERILYGLGLFAETLKTVKSVGEGRALTELALVKLARAGRLRSLDDLVADLEAIERKIGPSGGGTAAPAPAAPPGREAPATAPAAPVSPPAPEKAPGDDALFENTALPEGALAGEDSVKLTIDRVRESWDALLERLNRRGSAVGSFLASGRVLGLTDDSIEIGFPPSSRFQKTQLDEPERIRVVEEELRELFGVPLRLKTAVTAAAADSEADSEADEETSAGEKERVGRDELDRIGREPIVNLLKDVFMARLVHVERT